VPDLIFILLIAVIAFLYASVGHGGASGYLALMVIVGISPVVMKPTALLLNIFVSGIAFIQYYRQSYFSWKILWPFILLSIPLSYLGAGIHLEAHVYRMILAICLFIATLRLLGAFGKKNKTEIRPVNFFYAVILGGGIGLLSGMIGIGGGILLSPILIFLRWSDMKHTAAVSAAFIFLNSVSGIMGAATTSQELSSQIFVMSAAAIIGGTAGSFYGSSKFNSVTLRYVLSIVLLVACTKLVIS